MFLIQHVMHLFLYWKQIEDLHLISMYNLCKISLHTGYKGDHILFLQPSLEW